MALEGSPLVEVRRRARKHKVSLWHLSWAEVAHQAQLLIRHEGVGNAAHAWLLQELLHYLQHENSGCHGFQNMGPAWVPVRNGIDTDTLCQGDERAVAVVESWERLIRQVCLRLGGELGQKVLPVQRAKRGTDQASRRAELADRLCEEGRLSAELRIDTTPGILAITADLRTGKLRTSIEIPAPEQGYPLSWVKRLVRQLAEAPADLHVESLVEGNRGPRGTLERLRPEPGDLLRQGRGGRRRFPALPLQGHGQYARQRGVRLHQECGRGRGPLLCERRRPPHPVRRPGAPAGAAHRRVRGGRPRLRARARMVWGKARFLPAPGIVRHTTPVSAVFPRRPAGREPMGRR
ncbi:hypothetical protein SRIMM317S_02804 [Streptomyces rimosus subsp. rimosus]